MNSDKPKLDASAGGKVKISRPFRLAITLHGDRNCISVGKDIIRIVASPSHISLRVTEDSRSIALASCEATDVMSFRVPDTLFTDHRCIFRIYSKQFVRNIMSINGMDPLKSYSFEGIYSEKLSAIIFMLKIPE